MKKILDFNNKINYLISNVDIDVDNKDIINNYE